MHVLFVCMYMCVFIRLEYYGICLCREQAFASIVSTLMARSKSAFPVEHASQMKSRQKIAANQATACVSNALT